MIVLAYTGLRWSELVGLRVKDIDLTARRLYVRRAAPEVKGRIVIGPPKTCAGIQTVPLPQVVVEILKRRISGRAADDPAITSPNGKMLRSNNWRRHTRWNKALQKTEPAPLTIHGLRHIYTSLTRRSGAELRYVQKTMAARRRPSPRISSTTSMPTSWIRSQRTSISFMQPRFAHRRPNKGLPKKTAHRVQNSRSLKQKMVARAGIEPATFRFGVEVSRHAVKITNIAGGQPDSTTHTTH